MKSLLNQSATLRACIHTFYFSKGIHDSGYSLARSNQQVGLELAATLSLYGPVLETMRCLVGDREFISSAVFEADVCELFGQWIGDELLAFRIPDSPACVRELAGCFLGFLTRSDIDTNGYQRAQGILAAAFPECAELELHTFRAPMIADDYFLMSSNINILRIRTRTVADQIDFFGTAPALDQLISKHYDGSGFGLELTKVSDARPIDWTFLLPGIPSACVGHNDASFTFARESSTS